MRTRTFVFFLGVAVLVCTLVCPVRAQQSEKRAEDEFLPVEDPTEPPATLFGELYNVSTSIELGGQVARIRGNDGVYRSHLNFSDGFRLFGFQTRGEGQPGSFFTDFYLQMAGWGGDPQNWARFGASKEEWFDFRGSYRRQEYFWLFPGFARDQRLNDQQRRLQTYDLTLLPRRPVRFRLGYTRNSSFTGVPAVNFTTGDVEGTRDEFMFFEPLRTTYDEYRAGVEWTLRGWDFALEQGYRFFRNERLVFLPENCTVADNAACIAAGTFNPGNDPSDPALVSLLDRTQPIRDRIDFTRATVVGRPAESVEVVARLVHSDIDTDASRFENVVGRTFTGTDFHNLFTSLMEADRPYTTVDLGATWRPFRNLTVSDTFRFDQWNLSGLGTFTLFEFFPVAGTSVFDSVIDGRRLLFEGYRNRFEGRYDFNRYVSLRGGFEYAHRDVQLDEFEFECSTPPLSTSPSCPSIVGASADSARVDLNTRTFLLGVILRPVRTLSVFFDLERGNATGIFTRLSPNNVDRIRTRARWEPWRGVRFSASWFIFDNENSNLPTTAVVFGPPVVVDAQGQHNVRNRGGSIDFQLSRFSRGYLNLGYARHDISSRTDVVFFTGFIFPAGFVPQDGTSVYLLNEHYAYIDLGGRLVGDLYGDLGYRVASTSGTFPASDPLGVCDPLRPGVCDSTALGPLESNRGGLNFHQPHVGLRYQFNESMSWKSNWRWYGYNQKQGTISDYKAHIITTSVVLTF